MSELVRGDRVLVGLHVYLDRESQPRFDGLYEDGGSYEDMHMACIRIKVMRLM
jgi:hypothetical protein